VERSAFSIDLFGVEAAERSGRYRAEIVPGWGAPVFPNGGVVSALALQAMILELNRPEHVLRTSTTTFASTVTDGAVEIDVDVLRSGKRMSQLRSTIRNTESQDSGHHLMASFGEARAGVEIDSEPAPDVGEPDDYGPFPSPPDGIPAFRVGFFDHIDTRRIKLFQNWEDGWSGGTAEAMRWVSYRESSDPPDIFGLLPLADSMPAAIGQFLGPGHRFYHAPSVDLTLHWFAAPQSKWILTRSRVRFSWDGYVSAEIHLWDQTGRLVAYATQVMILRFP